MKTEGEKREIVEKVESLMESEGLKQPEACLRCGVSTATFYNFRKELEADDGEVEPEDDEVEAVFLDVRIAHRTGEDQTVYDVTLNGNGVEVEIADGNMVKFMPGSWETIKTEIDALMEQLL